MLSRLSLVPAIRERGGLHHDDWAIDGVPLREWVDVRLGQRQEWDVVGLPDDETVARRMVDVLRRRAQAELTSGRAVLYRCPECFDLGCGAFVARVTRSDHEIVWTDFAWETDYEFVAPAGGREFAALPEIRFDAAQYDSVLRLRLAATQTAPPPDDRGGAYCAP